MTTTTAPPSASEVDLTIYEESAEQALLAVMLTNDDACTLAAAKVRPEDFWHPGRRRVCAAILKLHAGGAAVDLVTVSAACPKDRDLVGYLGGLVEPVAAHAGSYITTLIGTSAKRTLLGATHQLESAVRSTNGDVGALLGTAETIFSDAVCDIRARVGGAGATGKSFIDWAAFWDRDHSDVEWAHPDVLALGRGHSIYGVHKEGKSLLMLWIAAQLATGKEPFVVIYLDYEMTEADLLDRLEDMGYGPQTDLSRLRYALLPTLPPLDSAGGGSALTQMVDGIQAEWPDHHLVVIIDTISRAVCGEENSADTFRDFYAHTGIELKRRGITWARLDHGGKDASQGQRGSSGKGDDVDVVWKLTSTQNGVCLHRDLARMPWVLPSVTFGLFDDPLRYQRLAGDWPAGTGEVANILDRLEVPLEASTREAAAALKNVNEGRRRQIVVAAMRFRVERLNEAS